MNGDNQSFEANFMKDVKLGAMEAEKPKKSFSLSPKMVGVGLLVLVMGGVLVGLMVMKGGKEGGSTRSIVGTWSCNDGSEVTFSEDGKAVWADEVGIIEDEYATVDGVTKFAAVEASYRDEQIVISMDGGVLAICERGV